MQNKIIFDVENHNSSETMLLFNGNPQLPGNPSS